MLIPKGNIVHENLSTAFTHIDQLVEGLKEKSFSGYCHVSFWEFDGILFFENGDILDAREEKGTRAVEVHIGDLAINNVLKKAREKDGEISVYLLPREKVVLLVDSLEGTPKYEQLSTDLTSLDKVIGLLKKEQLSGYVEVLLEHEAGIANLFFCEGELVESLLAPPDNQLITAATTIEEVSTLCNEHGGVFNVYQATDAFTGETLHESQRNVPQEVINLCEAILVGLESIANATLKRGNLQTVLKTVIPQVADKYTFLDPFVGDFRYKNGYLSYNGDVFYEEFINGVCDLINAILESLLTMVPRNVLLSKVSTTLEPVSTKYSKLIEQLDLEVRMPKIFQDYSFLEDTSDRESVKKGTEAHKVLNLRGIGVSEISQENILREFYRVISSVAQKYIETESNTIQYSRLKNSKEYKQYLTATSLLQKLNLSHFKTRDERLAFWINLYNFLVIEGILECGVSTSVHDIKGFFTKTSYRLGEYLFSLDDIEHGILRNNQRRPYSLFRQFSGSDPRKTFCVAPPDSRIHCCFCSGTKSSPPLNIYMSKELSQQLNSAVTRHLLTNGLRLDREKNELWLNRIFYWYRKDFDIGDKDLLDFVIKALQKRDIGQFIQANRSNLTLRFMDYDWSLNGK